jgi:hypothetical protein
MSRRWSSARAVNLVAVFLVANSAAAPLPRWDSAHPDANPGPRKFKAMGKKGMGLDADVEKVQAATVAPSEPSYVPTGPPCRTPDCGLTAAQRRKRVSNKEYASVHAYMQTFDPSRCKRGQFIGVENALEPRVRVCMDGVPPPPTPGNLQNQWTALSTPLALLTTGYSMIL